MYIILSVIFLIQYEFLEKVDETVLWSKTVASICLQFYISTKRFSFISFRKTWVIYNLHTRWLTKATSYREPVIVNDCYFCFPYKTNQKLRLTILNKLRIPKKSSGRSNEAINIINRDRSCCGNHLQVTLEATCGEINKELGVPIIKQPLLGVW